MHLGTNLSARQLVRAVGVSGGLALAFFFAGVVMADGTSGTSTPTPTATVQTTNASSTTVATPTATTQTNAPKTDSSTPKSGDTTSSGSNTTSGSATAASGSNQTASESSKASSSGAAANTSTGTCDSCDNGKQTSKDTTNNTTTQVIVQVAPTTAIATATNYGHGSATATAVANPKQTASTSSDSAANDPSANFGNSHGSANSTTTNTTTQSITQDAPTTATANATNYGNGTASAVAVAAPTQVAGISSTTKTLDNADNIGLNGCGCQSADNSTSSTTTQTISQSAETSATATATNGSACGCGNGGNGTATAVAIAEPSQVAGESSTSNVQGSATNVGYNHNGGQYADNSSSNDVNQSIDQYAPTTATATATNYGGHGTTQTASAIAEAAPTQIALEASSATVSGSANNIAYGYGHGQSGQYANNDSSNDTTQSIDQSAPTSATATATNDGHHSDSSASAAAVAAPNQKAGETSVANVNGSATNYGLGRGDQIALNVSTNVTNQSIEQDAATDATANAENDGHWANQSASAIASAAPSQSAALASNAKVNGQAANANINSSDCGCSHNGGSLQFAGNTSSNDTEQTITQSAPTYATANAYNNGFGFGFGIECGCHSDPSTSTLSATAIAAAAPVQKAAISANTQVNGSAINEHVGNGAAFQVATNDSANSTDQTISQFAPTSATANATNYPGSFGVQQTATAIAVAAPKQSAAISNSASVNGAALNASNSTSSHGHHHGFGIQFASNSSDNTVDQTISQFAPTSATADATNFQLFAGKHGEQVATAIAAASPAQSASLSNKGSVNGAAANVGQGNGFQFATNTSDNTVDQTIVQCAPTSATADAVNAVVFAGKGNKQQSTAVAAANPSQAASISNSASVAGTALNAGLGSHGFGFQTANNSSDNTVDQTISQSAPTSATANASNIIFFGGWDNTQSVSAIAAAAPQQSAATKGSQSVKGSASNVGLGRVFQEAYNTSANVANQDIEQDLPTTATANGVNTILFGGSHNDQSTTAVSGAAPKQHASQAETDLVDGSASNAAISASCGCDAGSQYASNDSENFANQDIEQNAPTTADAEATNDLFLSSHVNAPVSAVAAANPSQSGSQVENNRAHGFARNAGVASGSDCSFENQDAENTNYNTNTQSLDQESANTADAIAAAEHHCTWGNWWGTESGSNNLFLPLFSAPANNSHASASATQNSSSKAASTNSVATPAANLGATTLSLSAPNLGIKFGLSMNDGLKIGTLSTKDLLSGNATLKLLQGSTGLNLHLSITTPWVQYATAVANETPFQVLFGFHTSVPASWATIL